VVIIGVGNLIRKDPYKIRSSNCLGGVGGVFATSKVFFITSRTRFVEPPLQTFFIVVDIINKIK
jgi:hypothetical protein